MLDTQVRDGRISQVLDEAFDELRAKGRIDVALYESRHPDLAAELRGLLDMLCTVDSVVDECRVSATGPVRSGTHGAAATQTLPTQIGRYRILEILGAGGMGTVYRAHDPQLDRMVALKVPRFDRSRPDHDKAIQRFLREARTAARVRHANVCPIYDAGEHEGSPYAVMACIEGVSLADLLHKQRLTPENAAEMVRKIALALDAVHAEGILHRDLKPANVLLDANREPLLTDFGLARALAASEHLTQEGAIIGTPAYMAPELIEKGADCATPMSDVYSLGVILYEMLTGRKPFDGPPLNILHKVTTTDAPPPRTLNPDLDPRLETIMLKAMAKEPNQRYQTSHALAEALSEWTSTSKVPPIRSVDNGQTAPRSLRPRWPWMVAALLLVGSSVLAWQIVIRVKDKDGKVTEMKLPEGIKEIEVVKDGKTIKVPLEGDKTPPGIDNTGNSAIKKQSDETGKEPALAPWPDLKAPVELDIVTDLSVKARFRVKSAHCGQFEALQKVAAAHEPICARLALDLGGSANLLIPLAIVKQAVTKDKLQVVTLIDGTSYTGTILTTVSGADGKQYDLSSVAEMKVIGARDAKPPAPAVVSLSIPNPVNRTFLVSPPQIYTGKGSGDSFQMKLDGKVVQGNLSDFSRMQMSPRDGEWAFTVQTPPDPARTGTLVMPNGWWWLHAAMTNGCLIVHSSNGKSAGFTIEKGKPAEKVPEQGKVGEIQRYLGHASGVICVAYSPDGKSFISSSSGELWLWDFDKRTERVRFPNTQGFIQSAAFSHDGERVIGPEGIGSVVVWEVKPGTKVSELARFKIANWVECVGAFPDRTRVFYTNPNGGRIYDLEKKEELPTRFLGVQATLSRNGRRLLSADGKTLYLWDTDTGKELSNVDVGGASHRVALSADGRHALAAVGNNVQQWDMDEKTEGRRLVGPASVHAVALSPDGKRALTGGFDSKLRLWDLKTGTQIHCFDGHTAAVSCVAFSPDGHQALSGSADKTVRLWQLPAK